MAGRILAASPPGARTAVVAGNAHTPVSPTELGVPMGARLAQQRPGVRDIQIRYGGGNYYNREPGEFPRYAAPEGRIRQYQQAGQLLLDLPAATEAVVPQRPTLADLISYRTALAPAIVTATSSDDEPEPAALERPDPVVIPADADGADDAAPAHHGGAARTCVTRLLRILEQDLHSDD